MLSWLEQKQRQKNERQENGVWYHQSNAHLEQKAPQSGVNIFLPSIFLSLEEALWLRLLRAEILLNRLHKNPMKGG